MDYTRIDLKRYVTITAWYGCNNDCIICMLSKVKNSLPLLNFDVYRKLIGDIVSAGVHDCLILSGAEITTFSELEKYAAFAASAGWFRKIQIQTNGRRLSDRGYAKQLVNAGVNEFFISLHGREEINDAITRRPGSFSETWEGLYAADEAGANVITSTVVTRLNFRDMPEFLSLLGRTPASEYHVWNYFPMQRTDTENLIISLAELNTVIPGMLDAVAVSGRPLVFKSFPQCIPVPEPGYIDGTLAYTVIPPLYWKYFNENGFGSCTHRTGCKAKECWGLSSAYIAKYGDDRDLLSPFLSEEDAAGAAC